MFTLQRNCNDRARYNCASTAALVLAVVNKSMRVAIVDDDTEFAGFVRGVLSDAGHHVVVSHTGVKGTCDNQRNLSDEQLKAIAKTGGIIGIGFWETAVCGEDANSIAKAIRYAANVVSVEHIALGSDFDGSVKVPFDTSGEALITEALLGENFSEEEIAKIMGGNVLRLLSENLPD